MSQNALFDLSGRTAAVVGGGSGIGEAVALGAATQGAAVIVLDLDEAAAPAVAARIGGQTGAAGLDVRDGRAVRDSLDRIARDRGRLDLVAFPAGGKARKSILQHSGAEYRGGGA